MKSAGPFHDYLQSIDAMMIPYGEGMEIVGMCDAVELEYAAIRKGVALFPCAHRGLLKLTGKDRLDFLHRMTTQELRSLQPGDVRRAFILNSKGRITADLWVAHGESHTLVDCDIHDVNHVAADLDKLLFSEDVAVQNLSGRHHRVSLHGPRAAEVHAWWLDRGQPSLDYRLDEIGVSGVHIWAESESLKIFSDRAADLLDTFNLRFTGWHAVNIARIEAGRALFHIDFGPDNLPHETGPLLLAEAVSFNKGCYRGQEIVARMQSRGHPVKQSVGFRVTGEALPVAGVPVYAQVSTSGEPVGAVTSSTLSPMLGQQPIGMAMVKWDYREPGVKLFVPAEGRQTEITVAPMRFLE